MRRGGFDQMPVGVERCDALVGVGPIPCPITVDPNVGFVLPVLRAGSGVQEAGLEFPDLAAVPIILRAGGREPRDMFPVPFIWPAGERHGFAAVKKFAMRRDAGAGEPARTQLAELRNSRRPQIQL